MNYLNPTLNTSNMSANKNAANKPRSVKTRNFNRIVCKKLNKTSTATNLDERVTYATAMRDYWFKFMLGVDGGDPSKAFILAMLFLSIPDMRKLPNLTNEQELEELMSYIHVSPSRVDPDRNLATDCRYEVTLNEKSLEGKTDSCCSPHRHGVFLDILRRGVIITTEAQFQKHHGIDSDIVTREDTYVAFCKSQDVGNGQKNGKALKIDIAPRSTLAAIFVRDNKQKTIGQSSYFPKYDLTPHNCQDGRGDVTSYIPLPVFSKKDAPKKHTGFQYVQVKDANVSLTKDAMKEKEKYISFVQGLKDKSDKMVEKFFEDDYRNRCSDNKKRPALVLDDGGLSTEKGKRKGEDQSSQNACSGNDINETPQKNEYIHLLALKLVQEVVFVIGHSQFMYPALVDGFLPLVREMCKKLEHSQFNVESMNGLKQRCLKKQVLELAEETQSKEKQIQKKKKQIKALTKEREADRQKIMELEKKLAERDAQAEQIGVLLKNVNDNTKAISEIAKTTEALQNVFKSALPFIGNGFGSPLNGSNKCGISANQTIFPLPGYVPMPIPSGTVNVSLNGYGNSPLNVLGQFSTSVSTNTFSPPISNVS